MRESLQVSQELLHELVHVCTESEDCNELCRLRQECRRLHDIIHIDEQKEADNAKTARG